MDFNFASGHGRGRNNAFEMRGGGGTGMKKAHE
jgi:hypothetical protein